MRAETAKYAQR